MVPPRKVLSMELVPPNSKKWLSTLVPHKTQKMIEFLTNNFSVWKNTGFFCRKSQFISYRGLCNASQGMVCAPASVSSGKETPGYLCGSNPGWICAKVIKILFNLLLCDHQLQVACSHSILCRCRWWGFWGQKSLSNVALCLFVCHFCVFPPFASHFPWLVTH